MEEKSFNVHVEKQLWEDFKKCIRKVFWEDGKNIQDTINELIKKFVEENLNGRS